MITFVISIVILISAYFVYSRITERIFGIDVNRATPAITMADGMDYVPMPLWKLFIIQFLNIAGLGPIFGAVAGAMWGPVAFLWIVLGAIFAGSVHDYFSGMLSVKHKGESITEISGRYLGNPVKQLMRIISVVLLIMVGTVFIVGPARILVDLAPGIGGLSFWIILIFFYYILSTILPIDKIIGKVYPVFGIALLFMALGILYVMLKEKLPIPELNAASFNNLHVSPGSFPVFPMLFVTIACGAISGFHATQSPLMARCITNERQGRPVFFGAMITEGIVALIWAAIAMSFFRSTAGLNEVMEQQKGNAAYVVNIISNSLLGKIGGTLAILGVVAAPITSGDTAFRSARLIIADFMKLKQRPLLNRIYITAPIFLVGFLLTRIDFAIVWRYFAWTNQTVSVVVLWTITAYLIKESKFYWVSLIPAVFMTAVVVSYILVAPEGFQLSSNVSYIIGSLAAFIMLILSLLSVYKQRKNGLISDLSITH